MVFLDWRYQKVIHAQRFEWRGRMDNSVCDCVRLFFARACVYVWALFLPESSPRVLFSSTLSQDRLIVLRVQSFIAYVTESDFLCDAEGFCFLFGGAGPSDSLTFPSSDIPLPRRPSIKLELFNRFSHKNIIDLSSQDPIDAYSDDATMANISTDTNTSPSSTFFESLNYPNRSQEYGEWG